LLVERIAHRTSPVFAPEELLKQQEPKPAVFLDRDGTLNTLQEYLSDPKLFELIPGVIEGLRILREAGFLLIVTTNQPGIGLGYFSREDLYRLNSKMMGLLTKGGVKLDKIYFCPHSEAEDCSCRKPKMGMIERACRELAVIHTKRYVVGDMTSDVQFARNAGCKAIQLKTGKAGLDGRYSATPDYWAEDLIQAAQWIVADAGL
jgi:histidinol-phosphate phosphatase family protein